jgi:hypothetical protein
MFSNHFTHVQTISAIKCMLQANVFIIFWFHDLDSVHLCAKQFVLYWCLHGVYWCLHGVSSRVPASVFVKV